MTAGPIVELRDVRKSFDNNEVLRGVSLTLAKGTTPNELASASLQRPRQAT